MLEPNRVVPSDRLVDLLWGEQPPATAPNALQVYVSQLRKLLPPETLVTQAPGYCLRVAPEAVDLHRFEQLAAEGREALAEGRAAEAAEKLREALGLWRGVPFADAAFERLAQAETPRLDELRLAVLEDRIDADLSLGRHGALTGELEGLVREHPLRERLRGQLMLALYRSGRQAEALEQYQDARRALVDELGIDPSPALQALEKSILQQDPSLNISPVPASAPVTVGAGVGLPAAPTPLVGRKQELADAVELGRRDDIRLITFTGPGGIGKTRLALEVARELSADYADGAHFVRLEPIADPTLVAPTVGQALGLTGTAADPAETLQRYVADQSVLLLIDSFEQVLPAAPLLGALLAASPRLKLLVTSRAVLRLSGEREFQVPPLAVPDGKVGPEELARVPSVALFLQRAEAVKHDFAITAENSEAVAELCKQLEGLPLAIELAAARTKLLPPAAMLDRLGSRLDLLRGGARDAPARQQTLRTTIDWSYDLLEPAEQRLFARLAVFVGGCTIAGAEAVCDGDLDVFEGIGSLVDKSLVRERGAAEPRFSMLDTVREYATEKLAESGEEDALRHRHLAYFLELADAAEPEFHGPNQRRWMERLAADHDNVRGAMAFAFDAGEAESALRLGVGIRRFWEYNGYFVEGRRLLERALEAAPEAELVLRVKAFNGAGVLSAEAGDFEAAEDYFSRSLELARELGDLTRIGSAMTNLGNLYLFRGDYEAARSAYDETIRLFRQVEDNSQLSVAMEDRALVAQLEERPDEAIEWLHESLEVAREAGNAHNIASSLRTLARVQLSEGDVESPEPLLRESLELSRDALEPRLIADCLESFGGLAAARREPIRAAFLFGAADELRRSITAVRPPDQDPWYEHYLGLARGATGSDEFDAEYERGRNVPLEDAIAAALS